MNLGQVKLEHAVIFIKRFYRSFLNSLNLLQLEQNEQKKRFFASKIGEIRSFRSYVHPSVFSPVCLSILLELDHLLFLNERRVFEKTALSPKWGNWAKNKFFLNLLKNLFIYIFLICSIMKVLSIFCVSTQIPYFDCISKRNVLNKLIF